MQIARFKDTDLKSEVGATRKVRKGAVRRQLHARVERLVAEEKREPGAVWTFDDDCCLRVAPPNPCTRYCPVLCELRAHVHTIPNESAHNFETNFPQ